MQFSVSPIVYNFLIESISELELDLENIENRLGYRLHYTKGRVSFIRTLRLWKSIEQLSNRTDIGLILADYFTIEKAGLLGEVFLNGHTIKESMLMVNRYLPLLMSNISMKYQEVGNRVVFSFNFFPEIFIPFSVLEFYMKICYNWVSRFLRREDIQSFNIYEIHYFAREPLHLHYYKKKFPKTKLYFFDFNNYVIMDRDTFYVPNTHYKKSVYEYIMVYATEMKSDVLNQGSFSALIADHILMDLGERSHSIQQLSKDINMSVSSIKRKLKAEDSSFKELSNHIKKELCTIMILDIQLRYEDISFLLGYSDYSAFYKAFKKWFKMTPTQYRENFL